MKAHLRLVSVPGCGAWLHGFPSRVGKTLIDAPFSGSQSKGDCTCGYYKSPLTALSAEQAWTFLQTMPWCACGIGSCDTML